MPTLREQVRVYGASTLSPVELLTLALLPAPGNAIPGDLQTLLSRLLTQGDWTELARASVDELHQQGLSLSHAEQVVAICELGQRLTVLAQEPLSTIGSPEDAVRLLQPLMVHLPQEVFRVLVLNARNQVVANLELYRGTALSTEIRIAEILRPAIVRHCPALLVAHHHPSGNPEPSAADLETTTDLHQAARLCGIELVDHLILANRSALSLRSRLHW